MQFNKSRYLGNNLVDRNGRTILSLRVKPTFNQSNMTLHTVEQGQTLPYISYFYYKNASYFWAILDANPELQCEFDLKSGTELHPV